MSSIYVSQPKTHGKVILKTTLGDVEIELFSKEAPKACRNFVQLCLERFYDQKLFHRVVPEFIGQTGAIDQETGQGGESIYGAPFEDEFQSRLKFTQRGMVACAAGNNQNDSQFFITLTQNCEQLNFKHTIFGKVVGETIFNVLKMNQLEIDESSAFKDRPVYPPKILSIEVANNPFQDLVIRTDKFTSPSLQNKPSSTLDTKATIPAKKVTKHVISFLQEEEETDQDILHTSIVMPMPTKKKTQSTTLVNQNYTSQKDNSSKPDISSQAPKESTMQSTQKVDFTEKKPSLVSSSVAAQTSQISKSPKRKADPQDAKQYLQEQREKYKRKKKGEDETLEKFLSFTSKLQNSSDEKKKADDKNWMGHSLHFQD